MSITGEQRATLLITLAVTCGILFWDWLLMKDEVAGNTISAAIKASSIYIPIPLLFGIWMSHMFWHQSGMYDYENRGLRILAFLILVVGSWIWCEISQDKVRVWFSNHPELVLIFGYVSGYFVWPQYKGTIGS